MRQNNRNPLQAMALMSAIVSQLVGSILIGIFSGRWLDRQWGTEPIFLIIGLLIGLGGGYLFHASFNPPFLFRRINNYARIQRNVQQAA